VGKGDGACKTEKNSKIQGNAIAEQRRHRFGGVGLLPIFVAREAMDSDDSDCDVTELELELELDLELEQESDEDERVLVLGLVLRLNVFVEYLAEEIFFSFERLNFSGWDIIFSNL
jgi:hypothetical protein